MQHAIYVKCATTPAPTEDKSGTAAAIYSEDREALAERISGTYLGHLASVADEERQGLATAASSDTLAMIFLLKNSQAASQAARNLS